MKMKSFKEITDREGICPFCPCKRRSCACRRWDQAFRMPGGGQKTAKRPSAPLISLCAASTRSFWNAEPRLDAPAGILSPHVDNIEYQVSAPPERFFPECHETVQKLVNAKEICPKIDNVFCPGTDENLAGCKRRVYRQGGMNEKKERCGMGSHLS